MKFHSGYAAGKSRPERLSLCREWRSAQTRACAGPQGTQNFRPVADVFSGESEPHPVRIRRSGGQVSSGAVNYAVSHYSWTAAAANQASFRAAHDAVLEIPSARRRYFLECEMGTHPILSGKHPKPGSTIAKVQSYEGFLRSYVDASATQTFYARSYPDKYVPEVLFLVRTPHRAEAINEAIRQWRERLGTQTCVARALTIDAARDEFLKMLGGRSNRKEKNAAAEQQRGLSSQEIATVRRFYNGTVLAFKEMRAKARAQREAPPSYPPLVEEMQALVERLSAPGR